LYENKNNITLKGTPIFAKSIQSDPTLWAAIYEKAWSKIIGSYSTSAGGFTYQSLRAMTGVPVKEVFINQLQEDELSLW
jgi:hypothetical protein